MAENADQRKWRQTRSVSQASAQIGREPQLVKCFGGVYTFESSWLFCATRIRFWNSFMAESGCYLSGNAMDLDDDVTDVYWRHRTDL